MTGRFRALLLLSASLVIGTTCRQSASPRCPSEAVITAIHASAFYYQSGAFDAGEQHLREAHSLFTSGARDATTPDLLERLDQMAVLPSTAGDERARLAEQLRFTLADWQCLSAPLHDSLHRMLPAIPGA